MTRRPIMVVCAEPDCRETGFVQGENAADDQKIRTKSWLCGRHTKPDEVLSLVFLVGRQERGTTLEVYEEAYGRFWGEIGAGKGSRGLVSGPGFRAYAEDFPVGTRLHVEARLEKPRACPPDDPRCNYPECSCWEMA